MDLLIDPTGEITTLYSEVLDLEALGALNIERASHVEPDDQGPGRPRSATAHTWDHSPATARHLRRLRIPGPSWGSLLRSSCSLAVVLGRGQLTRKNSLVTGECPKRWQN